MTINAMPLVVGALCVMAIFYRYYHGFIAAKVVALDDSRKTPAYTMYDGQNYYPTSRWVLFGHHFAAITGAGPLIGPVLAAQFGVLPGYLWILVGVVLAGAVHDFIIFFASVRHGGKSLAEIARIQISPLSGIVASIAILFILVVALAGLGLVVVNALSESSWGTFTIACTIPIALFMGLYMYRFRRGRIAEGTIIGVILLILAVIFGKDIAHSSLATYFTFPKPKITLFILIYGFVASVLPVWMLLCPRDYLSSFMKIGTIAFLAIGIIIVHPELKMPHITEYIYGGGPIIPGSLFPFAFITIACGAISGFHSLVASGTSPKMVSKESDIRVIGFGAMLIEGFIAILALVAACSLFPGDYFAINVSPQVFETLGLNTVNLDQLSKEVGENLVGRTGGAVSLAVGMAQIFTSIPGMRHLMDYWYHFAIMFEALFILTTIDTGTRVARFMIQEFGGKIYKPFERVDHLPSAIISSALISCGWGYFVFTGSISTIWPMFGTANQLLAGIALCVGTTFIINIGKARYAWVTIIPMAFVMATTLSASWLNITDNFLPLAKRDGFAIQGYVNSLLTAVMMICAVIILIDSFRTWYKVVFVEKKEVRISKEEVVSE
ncbi:MAG: carbon starvation protein CstA, carbon starvation protein [Candidatus Dadabacteria bacterium CSP1-2]|nr:MAG: carbon starvation protein CstA, carbon starvation protein [Candidatus Dadabacteria bacterium CSP1-2]